MHHSRTNQLLEPPRCVIGQIPQSDCICDLRALLHGRILFQVLLVELGHAQAPEAILLSINNDTNSL